MGELTLTAISVYIWKQLVTSISSTSPTTHTLHHQQEAHYTQRYIWNLWRISVFLFLALAQTSLLIGRLLPAQDTPYSIVMLSYTCLGLYGILMGVLLPVEIMELCIGWCDAGVTSPSQRSSLGKRFKILAMVAVSMFILIQGLNTAWNGPVVKRISVPVHKLPEAFNGMTVVQLSDIHLGPTVGRQRMMQVVSEVKRLKPGTVSMERASMT